MNNQYQNYTSYQGYTPITLPQKPPRARLHVGIIAFAAALVMVITAIAQVLIDDFAMAKNPALAENAWYSWALSGLPMYLIGMPVAFLLLLAIPAKAPQKKKSNPLMWFGFLFLCFALTYIANFIGQYFIAWLTNETNLEVENEVQKATSVTPFEINLIFIGILAPIFEELFYRKAIIDRLRRYGDRPAILISGLIFGLAHGNFNQIFYTVAVGMLLGLIYIRTGSVLYTISIHAAFNMIGGVFTTELVRRMDENLAPVQGDTIGMVMSLAYSIFIILSLVVGIIFLIANLRRFNRSLQKGEYTLSFDKWMNALVINPGMWVFLALIALLLITSLFV